MLKIKVDPRTGLSYLPKSLRDEGFSGDIELLSSALTITLIKPGAKLSDVDRSLELIKDEIKLRLQQEVKLQPKEHDFSRKSTVRQEEGLRCPIFRKYSRNYLGQVTGYSRGYLSRIARGRIPLSQSFVERCCFKLHETEDDLFGAQVLSKE